jgi:hypothetical protein
MYIMYNFVRDADDAEVQEEMDSCKEMGEQFHQESGDLMKLVGVLRAADILWNPAKK